MITRPPGVRPPDPANARIAEVIRFFDWPGEVRLRPVAPEDGFSLKTLFFNYRLPDFADSAATVATQIIDMQYRARGFDYDLHWPDRSQVVIESGDHLIGRFDFALPEDRLHLIDLMIMREMRRRGIGTAILQALIAYARSCNCRRLTLTVGINNPLAMQLYERHGFVALPVTEDTAVVRRMALAL